MALIQEACVCGDQIRALCSKRWTLHFAGPGISRSCICFRSTIYAFCLLELCIGGVTTVNMTYTGERSSRERTCTSVYLTWFKPPLLKSYRTLWVTVIGIQCFSSLDMMLLRTTFYGGTWASINMENLSGIW